MVEYTPYKTIEDKREMTVVDEGKNDSCIFWLTKRNFDILTQLTIYNSLREHQLSDDDDESVITIFSCIPFCIKMQLCNAKIGYKSYMCNV